MTGANYETGLAATDDIPAILAMQDVNLHENGGGLSVRQTADWFRRTMSEMPIVVARRNGVAVGYALATSIAAKSHVGIVQTMLRAFPAPPSCYLYGSVCVAESERGNGLAAMMYQEMRKRLPGRMAMSFVRSDNMPSIRANRKMGKMELGEFMHDGETYLVFAFTS
jgi:L-amino acid N-acyltransferase YncA